jgi:hypothetical protein
MRWYFSILHTTIYEAKKYCLLLPDIGIPYDIQSRSRILSHFNKEDMTYAEMLLRFRDDLCLTLSEKNETLNHFRRLDDLKKVPFRIESIALPRPDFRYSGEYTPEERPISRIVDKMYYAPKSKSMEGLKHAHNYNNPSRPNLIQIEGEIKPLSGNGASIFWNEEHSVVIWGDLRFKLNDQIVNDIYRIFFKDGKWHPLGASMTNPTKGGLGVFVATHFAGLSPRHASAIAALMAKEGLIVHSGKKPILLKRANPIDGHPLFMKG